MAAAVTRFAGVDIVTLPTTQKLVALIFDAGANADGVPKILATLTAKQVPGTFFLTGSFVRHFPDQTTAIVATGHPVGNHSDTHPDFRTLSPDQIAEQMQAAEREIIGVGGADPHPLFRFPYGGRSLDAHRQATDSGYVSVAWSVDTLGWKGTSDGMLVDSVVARVIGAARPGEIVLMHVGSHPSDRSTLDADALGRVIDELRARGYEFATVPHALGLA